MSASCQCVEHAKIFNQNETWRGECKLECDQQAAIDKQGVYSFAKDIAGPIAQIHLCQNSIPVGVAEVMETKGGLLAGLWWLRKNAPETKFNWHSDMDFWFDSRSRHQESLLQNYYEIERRVSSWFQQSATQTGVKQLADIFVEHGSLQREALLKINVSEIPDLILPDRL